MTPGQHQMHMSTLMMACGSGSSEPEEIDYEEKYEELLDIVRNAVSKNPTTIDSSLVDYIEEHDE